VNPRAVMATFISRVLVGVLVVGLLTVLPSVVERLVSP
jgi:hypothetical protein